MIRFYMVSLALPYTLILTLVTRQIEFQTANSKPASNTLLVVVFSIAQWPSVWEKAVHLDFSLCKLFYFMLF